jgi:nucleolin
VKPRSITTYTPAFRSVKQQWIVPSLQRRWASDDAEKPVESAEAAAAEAENFAQTRPEAPIEENLTPAQQAAQADPTDASRTAGADALEAVFQGKREGSLRKGGRDGNFPVEPVEPGKVLYVGNLYYEVNEDQLKRIFSRFGAIDSIKIVRDNRNLSRGYVINVIRALLATSSREIRTDMYSLDSVT